MAGVHQGHAVADAAVADHAPMLAPQAQAVMSAPLPVREVGDWGDAGDAGDAGAQGGAGECGGGSALRVVIDTNVVLDLFLFQDPRMPELAAAIEAGQIVWLRTPRMREECRRVLAYPHLQTVAATKAVTAAQVLTHFDAMATEVAVAEAAPMRCRDGDDQCFIDLAVAHGALLISKDKHVLKLRKRLKKAGITVSPTWVDMLPEPTEAASADPAAANPAGGGL